MTNIQFSNYKNDARLDLVIAVLTVILCVVFSFLLGFQYWWLSLFGSSLDTQHNLTKFWEHINNKPSKELINLVLLVLMGLGLVKLRVRQ